MKPFAANLTPAWRIPLLTGLAARLGLALWGLFSFLLGIPAEVMERLQVYYYGVPPITQGFSGAVWGVWQRWDAILYMRIASSGYTHSELTAFFPLYPALAGALSALSGVHVLAMLSLISLVSTLLVMHLLYRLVAEFIHPGWAAPSVIMLALFPSSFFFFAPYPQSFGLFLLLLAMFSALKQRWLAAACAGLAAGLTHSTVAPLAVSLGVLALAPLWPYLSRFVPRSVQPAVQRLLSAPVGILRRRNWLALPAALTPILGTLLFLAWREFSGFPPFAPYLLERWGRFTQWPWNTFLRLPELFLPDYFAAAGWVNLSVLALALTVTVWCIRRLPAWLWLYQLTGLVLLLSQDTTDQVLGGLNRYALFLFPMFIALAAWTDGKKRLRFYLWVGFGLIQLYLSLLFMQWVLVG